MSPNVRDRSGQGNHGYLTSITATTSMFTPGRRGQALQFDGVDDDVRILDTASIDGATGAGQARTWSFWLRKGTGSNNLVIDKSSIFNGNHIWVEYTTGSKIRGGVVAATGLTSASTLRTGEWYHVTFTYDGSNTRMYINGRLDAGPTAQTAPADDNSAIFVMGYTSEQYSAAGALDDLRIYDRALSAAEVSALYRLNNARFSSTPVGVVGEGLRRGLVGHWTFDGGDMSPTVLDKSGNGWHARLVNMTATTTAIGVVGQAIKFNGVNQFASTTSFTALNSATQLTVCGWSMIPSLSGTDDVGDAAIFAKGFNTGIADENLMLWYNVNALPGDGLQVYTFNVGNVSSLTNRVNGVTKATPNVWQHVCGVMNGTNRYVYLNGNLDASEGSAVLGTYPGGTTDARLGGWADNGNFYHEGKIDDVRVYNRAFSAFEIQQLYAMGASRIATAPTVPQGEGLTSGLVGYWRFDGADINWATGSVVDRSGQENTGQIVNLSTTTTPVIGASGQAFYFDGTAGVVTGGSASMIDNMSALSIAVWAKANGYGEAGQGYFLDKRNNATGGWHFQNLITGGRIEFTVDFDGTDLDVYSANNTFTTSDFGQWTHWVVTWDGSTASTSVRMYKNGFEVSYSPSTVDGVGSRVDDSARILGIGNRPTDGRTFHGALDEVRLYNRVLSAGEVKQLYNNGR